MKGDNNILEDLSRLSKGTLKRMRAVGLNPEELSKEQLEALEGLENPEKQHWLTKIFTLGATILGIGAIVLLINGDFITFIKAGLLSVMLMYIGYRIQVRITARKFIEATTQMVFKKAIRRFEKYNK